MDNRINDLISEVMSTVFEVIVYGVVPKTDNPEELTDTMCKMAGEQIWNTLADGNCSLVEAIKVSAEIGKYLADLQEGGRVAFNKKNGS